jgi:hypothetical protein
MAAVTSSVAPIVGEDLTIEAIADELYLCLAKQRSYEKQAAYLMYRIPIYRPTPFFEIKISDLSKQVKKELDDRWKYKREIDYILKEAVGRIFANLDELYFLLSVKRLLKVRLTS